MEAARCPRSGSTGSKTIADLMALAAERRRPARRVRHKRDGAWHDVSFAEVGEIVSEIARGLIDLGIAARRPRRAAVHHAARVDLRGLRDHQRRRRRRPDLPDQLAERVRVGRRQLRVGADRLRGRRPRWPRSSRSARTCPRSSTVDRDRPERRRGDAIPLDDLRERGRGRDAAELAERAAAVTPDDPTRSSTPPAPPARRRAACSRTATTARCSTCASRSSARVEGDVAYLFLPLAHSYALLIQLLAFDLGATIAYFGGDPKQIVAELNEVHADLPAVGAADLREDLHARHRQRRPRADQGRHVRSG